MKNGLGKILTAILILGAVFFEIRLSFHQQPFRRQVTLKRLLLNPMKVIAASSPKISLGPTCAKANFQDHAGSSSVDDCDCAGPTNSDELWNDCMSCVMMAVMGAYNSVVSQFSTYIDPDIDVNNWLPIDGVNIRLYAGDSTVSGFDRVTRFSDRDSNAICLNLNYSKDETDTSRVKGVLHLDTANCPGGLLPVAFAMKFDLGYTDADVQDVSLMITTEDGAGSYDIADAGSDDQMIYQIFSVDSSSGSPITTGHSILLQKDTFIKLFVGGEDDVLLRFSEDGGAGLADTDVDEGTMLTNTCFNDATNTDLGALAACNAAGYTFTNFPVTVQTLGAKTYPSWTISTLTVTGAAGVQTYFP